MQVQNLSKRNYIHSKLDEDFRLVLLTLAPNEVKEIPDEVAKCWMNSGEVVEYVDPQIAKEREEKLMKENAELVKALEEAKKEVKTEVKKTSKKRKPSKK